MALRIPPRPGPIGRALVVAALVCSAVALIGAATVESASAQTDFFKFEQRPRPAKKSTVGRPTSKGDKQMMVQATEVQYDHVNQRVNAVGNVQIGIRMGGTLYTTYSGNRGNFFANNSGTSWSTAQIAIRTAAGTMVMPTNPSASGDCNTCHGSTNRIVTP